MSTDITKNLREIEELHLANLEALEESMERAFQIGGILEDIKVNIAHGRWDHWVQENLSFGRRMADRYIQLHNNMEAIQSSPVPLKSLGAAFKYIAEPKEEEEEEKKVEPDFEEVAFEEEMPDFGDDGEPDCLKDVGGMIVPPHLIPVWEERSRINAIVHKLSQVRGDVKELCESERLGTKFIVYNAFNSRLQELVRYLRFVRPHAVCRLCGGSGGVENGCETCNGGGFITETMWTSLSEDLKG